MVERRTLLFFAAASILFGGTFVAAKAGLAYFPPLLFVAFRFDVAAVALAAYAVLTSSRDDLLPRSRGDLVGILATGILSIGLTNALLFVGQQHATSAVASIVFSLNPILTPVFAALLWPTSGSRPAVVPACWSDSSASHWSSTPTRRCYCVETA